MDIQKILEWEPSNIEKDQIYRGRVPLANRKKGHKINPLASEEAKVQSLASMRSNAANYSPVGGSDTMDVYTFDYWQYLDSLVYWDSLIPTPDVIDSAHRNGVPVYGTVFFNWSTSEKDRESVRYFLKQDEDGNYLVAKKLVEIAEYYGFEGYFINQETSMPAGEGYGEKFREFLFYLKDYAKKIDYPIHIAWYDSVDNDGSRTHYDAVNAGNDLFVAPSEEGSNPTDAFFMNFNWEYTKVNDTVNHMKSLGRSPYDAFAGLELQAGGYYNTGQKRHALIDEKGQTKLSLGLFIPDTVLGIAEDGEDYHLEANKFWSGFEGNPAVAGDEQDWAGIARFVVDKTPILSADFHTYFNTGHGKYWFVNGEKVRDNPWNSRGIQDVMPTWRWWINNHQADIRGRYDFDEAFYGGTSLAFEGRLEEKSRSDIMLYSTAVEVQENTKMKVTSKATDSSFIQMGLSTDSEYAENSFQYYDLECSTDWSSQEIHINDLVGEKITAVKLVLQSDKPIKDYKLNLGEVAFYTKDEEVSAPKNVEFLETSFYNAQQAKAIIKIDPVAEAKQYEVYQFADNEWVFINASSSNYVYLANISRTSAAKGTEQRLKVVLQGENGQRSEPFEFVFDWGMTVEDTTLPEEEPENIMVEAEIESPIEAGNTENPANILTGTIDGTADKWYSPNRKAHVDVAFNEPRTVVRWVVEHAGAGGESVDNGLMNTKDFNLEYKNPETGEWEVAKEIRDNLAHVTDVVLEEPVTAADWRLNIFTADNGSPWGGIRIYNWKMYETHITESENLPMARSEAVNIADNLYSIALRDGIEGSKVFLFSDRQTQDQLAEGTVDSNGEVVFHKVPLEKASGLIYYRAQQPNLEKSNRLAIPYKRSTKEIRSIDLVDKETIEANQIQPLDLSAIDLSITYSDGTNDVIPLDHILVDVSDLDKEQFGQQTLSVSYAGLKSNTPLVVHYEIIDFEAKDVSGLQIIEFPKRRYLEGEAFDAANGLIRINYADGSHQEIPLSDTEFFTVSPLDNTQLGMQTLTIEHRGHRTRLDVMVEKEAVNLQRLQQLVSQYEALEHQEVYKNFSEDEKETIKDFIQLGRVKLADEEITQEEVDQMVALHTKWLQKLSN